MHQKCQLCIVVKMTNNECRRGGRERLFVRRRFVLDIFGIPFGEGKSGEGGGRDLSTYLSPLVSPLERGAPPPSRNWKHYGTRKAKEAERGGERMWGWEKIKQQKADFRARARLRVRFLS